MTEKRVFLGKKIYVDCIMFFFMFLDIFPS